MTAARMAPEVRAEVERLLRSGTAVARVARDLGVWADSVRAIRDEIGVPPRRDGWSRPAKPEPIPVEDPDVVDGDPTSATPRRIPPGLWCIERPFGDLWKAQVAAANRLQVGRFKDAMRQVLGLPLDASDVTVEDTLIVERRTAEHLAELYLAALERQ